MLIRRLEPVQVYSVKEFLSLEEHNERYTLFDKALEHIKRHKKKYLCLVLSLAILLFFFSPDQAIEVLAYTTTERLEKGKLEILNDVTVTVLMKVYCAICMGAVAVETISTGWGNEKKFSAIVVKYGICYAGGLLCISILNMLKSML